MPRQVATISLISLLCVVLAVVYLSLIPSKHEGVARVHMLDVGQGDSFFIQSANGKQLLIDGGRDDKVLLELSKVMPKGDRFIDVVIATHPDADHIGGLPLVLKRYTVGLFLTSQVFTDTKIFSSLYQELSDQNIPSYFVRRGMRLSLDQSNPAVFSILFPDRETNGWETNSASVVGRLQVGKRSALFTGDSPQSIEQHLASIDPQSIDVDILKLGHHGSKTSSSEVFLRTSSPGLALISAGVNNRYGHPAPEVVARLKSLNIPSVSTVDQGTVTFETDGEKWFKK